MLALIVVTSSFFILFVLIFFTFVNVLKFVEINSTEQRLGFNAEFSQYSIQIIGIILPVIGTWVGTVLAFYFARENFEAAEQAFLRSGKPSRRLVGDFMVPIDMLARFDNFDEQKEESTTIKTIRDIIKSKTIPRAIFLDKEGRVLYILHGDTVDRAIASKLKYRKNDKENEINENTTLKVFLDEIDFDLETTGIQKFREIAKLFRSVSRNGTLLECKKMFDSDPLLQNILVTDTGEKDKEKPLGLITRESLGEAAEDLSETT